jgi:hypothetical protein
MPWVLARVVEGGDLLQGIVGAGNLRQDEVSQLVPGPTDDDLQVLAPVRVGHVVDAGAEPRVAIGRVQQQVGDHRGMLGLAPGGSAVLAIAVTSNIGRSSTSKSDCSCRALRMFFSEPAKCSQAASAGKGLAPWYRTAAG